MGLSDYLVPCLSAFAACLGFCIIFNIRAPGMVICSIGGGLSWLVYLLVGIGAFIGAFLLDELISRIPILRWCVLGVGKEKKRV